MAQQAFAPGLVDGPGEAFNRQWIFRPNIKNSLACSDGIGRDGHSFQHAVWITFHDAAVHKGSGVAFIAIANDVFRSTAGLRNGGPFQASRKTGPAAPPQARLGYFRDNLLWRHAGEHFE